MRLPLEWLKEYVPVRSTPKALAERLTMAGLEVVGIHGDGAAAVLEIEVTPNRADCLSIIGLAREVAVATGQRLTALPSRGLADTGRARDRSSAASATKLRRAKSAIVIRVEDAKACPQYIGRVIEGVKVGPSPEWMQRRLTACGIRPINNVVDVTNYVLLEYGQPLHAFDAARLAQETIVVRRAGAGEPLTTLDGAKHALSSDVLVIADAKRPVAVAGVMGGVGSEVTSHTTRVLLESARFDPILVRRTARKLGLATESSYRFERGVDPAAVETASARAAALIVELAGGAVASVRDTGAAPPERRTITLDASRMNRWLGTAVSVPEIRTALARVSCRVASSDSRAPLRVNPPSFRQDLKEDVDLYEEVARLVGYDRIAPAMPMVSMASPANMRTQGGASSRSDAARYARLQSLSCLCASIGLTETINWSLVSEQELARCGYAVQDAVRLANPLSQDHAYLRPALLVGLLRAVRCNLTQGVPSVRFFEVGTVTRPGPVPAEAWRVGVALSGWWSRDWHATQPADFFQLKGLLQAITQRLCTGTLDIAAAAYPWAEPGQGASLQLNGHALGSAGRVSRKVAEALDFEQEVWVSEMDVDVLLASRRVIRAVQPPPSVPPVKRDISLVVSRETAYADVERLIRQTGGPLAERVELIDRYTGKQVASGKYSLTFSIEYRDPARTLTAAEVDALHQRVGQALSDQLGASLR